MQKRSGNSKRPESAGETEKPKGCLALFSLVVGGGCGIAAIGLGMAALACLSPSVFGDADILENSGWPLLSAAIVFAALYLLFRHGILDMIFFLLEYGSD